MTDRDRAIRELARRNLAVSILSFQHSIESQRERRSAIAEQSPKLATVLIDIAAAQSRCDNHWGDEIEGELLDQLEALRSEARSMIEELTGCEWGLIAEGNL